MDESRNLKTVQSKMARCVVLYNFLLITSNIPQFLHVAPYCCLARGFIANSNIETIFTKQKTDYGLLFQDLLTIDTGMVRSQAGV